jgi:hypothetical protein
MAHYAFLDENNVVVDVIVGKNEDEGLYDWEKFYGHERGMTCKRTSYNTWGGQHKEGGTPFRKNYAVIGGTYDPVRDAFIPPPEFPSWVLNEQTCLWEAPIPQPNDGYVYYWDEQEQNWSRYLT